MATVIKLCIVIVDSLNPHHIALNKLKLAAHNDVVRQFGRANTRTNTVKTMTVSSYRASITQ